MPPLHNARHERFAQERAGGRSVAEAYLAAGYRGGGGAASRLNARASVRARIENLQRAAAERAGITQAMVLAELGRIGFSDIRKVVRWSGEGGCELVSSHDVDDDIAAAIAEVSMTEKGAMRVKLHDKRAALVEIGKHLGMFRERVEHSGPGGGPIAVDDGELAELLLHQLIRGELASK